MIQAMQFEYMQNALMAAFLGSIACGVVGSYVVVKKIGYIGGGIAHAAFGGIGLGYYLGINPLYCIIPFSLVSAWAIGFISKRAKTGEDTAISILWASGMAIGIIFIGLTPGYAPDLFSYLFGNILTVPRTDIYFMATLDILIIVTVLFFFREFIAVCFDEEYSEASGMNTLFVYLLLLTLIAVTTVMLVRIVGIILVIALLTIPPAIAKQYCDNLLPMMIMSTILGLVLTVGGIWISFYLDLAAGATIILLLAASFIVSTGIRWLIRS